MSDSTPLPVWATAPAVPERQPRAAARRGRQFTVAAVVVAIVGINLGVASWFRPFDPPHFVPLWVTEYRHPFIPDRSGAAADRDAIRTAGLFPDTADTYSTQSNTLVLGELQKLSRVDDAENLVVYLSGYAVPGDDGDVTLLTADADPPADQQVVSVRKVLRLMTQAPARRKLLILDVTPPPTDPVFGFLRPDAPAVLSTLIASMQSETASTDQSRQNGLLILLPCQAGQTALASPVLGRSVFGYYFQEALGGAAIPYAPGGGWHSRRVSVRSLAAFLRVRVDRWARQNRGVRQTPVLIGDGPDFDLTVTTPAEADRPEPSASDPAPMPNLGPAHTLLDRWQADGGLTLSPRLYQRLQAAVRVAEATLANGGGDPESTRFLGEYLTGLRQEMAETRAYLPAPIVPTSLARARSDGEQLDAAVEAAAATLLAGYRRLPGGPSDVRAASEGKLVQSFLKSAAGKSVFAVESALVGLAPSVAGSVGELGLIGTVLATRGEDLVYAESRFLARLIAQARVTPEDRWPAALARSAVAAVVATEEAWTDPIVEVWARPLLMDCARRRWEGELLFREYGRVPDAEIARRFDDAIRMAATLTGFSTTLHSARSAFDSSLVSLVPELDWISRNPDQYPIWHAELRSSTALLPLLRTPDRPLDQTALQTRTDRLRGATATLQQCSNSFHDRSGGAAADWLFAAAALPSADASLVVALEAVGSLPGLSSERRAAFRAARRALETRLNASTLEADAADDRNRTKTEFVAVTDSQMIAARNEQAARSEVVVRGNLECLRLAGLADDELAELTGLLDRVVREGPDSTAWPTLSAGLARARTVSLAERLAAISPDDRALLTAVFPGSVSNSIVDTTGPGCRALNSRPVWEQFYGRLAETYRYAAVSGIDTEFLDDLAQAVAPNASTAPLDVIAITTAIPALTLRADRPTASVTFGIVVLAGTTERPQIRPLVRDSTLDVTAAIENDLGPISADGTATMRVTVTLGPGASASAVPTGFVIELAGSHWSTFVPVSLETSRLVRPLDLLVDRVPTDPVGLGDDVRVRPGAAQSVFVFARNLTQSSEKVAVKILGPQGPIGAPGGPSTLGPGSTLPTVLSADSGTPPAATPTSISLPATLTITAVDPAKPDDIMATRTITLSTAHPVEYVRLSAASFTPAVPPNDPLNRFEVSLHATRDLGSVPCSAELILDPKLVPGLRAVRAGRLAGPVPPGGSPLVLDGTGLVLDPESPTTGTAAVSVDGVDRVFRLKVDFARSGPPTAPVLDQSPYLELELADPPTPGRSIAFRVGADRAPPDATLDVRLLRAADAGPPSVEHEATFPRPLDQRATIAVGTKPGELLVTATVADWSAAWDLPQVIGRRTLEARLLSADGKVLLTKAIPVVLDDTPPSGVTFRAPPETAKVGAPLALRATASDPESGISGVSFFVGKLTNGQPPPGAVFIPAVRSPADPTTWAGIVPPPVTAKGPTDFGVKVVNGAGLSAYAEVSVNLVDQLPVKLGGIAGQVLLGSAGQPGLEVTLLDANSKAVKTTTTDSAGKFAFNDLKAGTYKLTASKVTPPRSGSASVQVRDATTTPVELSLYLTSNGP